MARKPKSPKQVDALTHDEARRVNVPTAEMASLYEQQAEILGEGERDMRMARPRPLAEGEERERDEDLDPQIIWNGVKIKLTGDQMRQLAQTGEIEIGEAQLVWRGKDRADWSDLVVNAPPVYVQEKVHPKAIIDDLKRRSEAARQETSDAPDLFADFNGLTDPEARTEFYSHAQHWTNRFILGDSLQVMASLAEREALKSKVQCIYFDPPYGIKFNSNWQVSTRSRDVKDGKKDHISREPEMVKAFRDTWKDGIHSYLTYLRDRLQVARELLTESGSIFVQIGDENVHRVRAVMDEVFGEENFVSLITFVKTSSQTDNLVAGVADYIVWFSKHRKGVKFRRLYRDKITGGEGASSYSRFRDEFGQDHALLANQKSGLAVLPDGARVFAPDNLTSQSPGTRYEVSYEGRQFFPTGYWKTEEAAMPRLLHARRVVPSGKTLRYVRYINDFPVYPYANNWDDTSGGVGADKVYVVQTSQKVIQRCILMATDPGDLVLDPTCGSGTTATVAEQWGRRWITIDTSRVALALARTRLMSARYPYYLLADSPEGREKEQDLTKKVLPNSPTGGDLRQGFVYERAPHITLKSIANNAEIDVIWDNWQEKLEPLRASLNHNVSQAWEEWEIPCEADESWSADTKKVHAGWWDGRVARQKEIDASIARAADVEYLYDRPYEDKGKVRVAGPFTVESLSPHRVFTAREDTLGAEIAAGEGALKRLPKNMVAADFGEMVLEHLRTAGVHQQNKGDTIRFTSLEPWPGEWLSAVGTYTDGSGRAMRAGVLIGPEFGTLTRGHITAAAREGSEARFDSLIACAFNFEAQTTGLDKLGPLAILKARMNPDLHMSDDLKNTGKGNLFVVFGEPDVELIETADGELQVKVMGVDVFDPSTGEIRSDGIDGIATWFIDTDYNEESFFVRHAYFLGANDPYNALKTSLKVEIDSDAWATLYSDISRPFPRPQSGRIAVKVINHFGDEVLKVFGV